MTDRAGLVFADLAAWKAWQADQQPLARLLVRRLKAGRHGGQLGATGWPRLLYARALRVLRRCPSCGRANRGARNFCSVEHMRSWYGRGAQA